MAERLPVKIRLAGIDVGEEEVAAIAAVFPTGTLVNGEQTRMFEEEFAARHESLHGVAFANGTVALAAMMLALGIGPGDEVLVPSLTFVSTATSVLHVGARPVFVDVDERTFNMDPTDAAAALSPATKAIMPVHYAGQPADMEALLPIAEHHGLWVLEDAAQAHGAAFAGRSAGAWGTSAMFSFTPTKNMTTGEGGLVTTSDADLSARLRLLRNHGQTSLYVHGALGYNWRMTEMQAAMGRVQLRKLDAILERKRRNVAWMNARLANVHGLHVPHVDPRARPVHMLYTLQLDGNRDAVLGAILDQGVEARMYFPPAHTQPIFSDAAKRPLPVTERLASRILSIPMHSKLSPHELELIGDVVEKAVSANR